MRYVMKPSEPLWFELAPSDSVIRQLPVSRAQGGTAHHVTADQWAQLMALVGGWPQPDASQDYEPSGWADAEIQPTVTAYSAMLRAELAGQSYVKAAFNREVQATTGRTPGAVEFKFANVSAVVRDIGLPYVLAITHAAITRARCVLRWSGSWLATRRSPAFSKRCQHLTCR